MHGTAVDPVPEPAPGRAWDRRFLLAALCWMLVLSAAYFRPYAEDSAPGRALQAYLWLQAHGAAALIALFDGAAAASGTTIGGRFPLRVVKACSSLDAQVLYAAAVLAFPVRWRMRALGVALGVAGITALNLGRIAGLYFVGALAPGWFDAIHEEVFPAALLGCALLGFALWARWVSRAAAV
jgi:exosortase/archaeosortase family protein